MNLLFSCSSLSKSYGTRALFKDLSLTIFSGNRIGLIGPNGSGKSTLLKILAGIERPDSGVLAPVKGLKIGYVPQSCSFPDQSPQDILMQTLQADPLLPDYEREQKAKTWLSKMGFTDFHTSAALLSGGWTKRLSIAKELILSPDVLFLDEPTNHLDLEGILLLEKILAKEAVTYLLVSHDRYFLQNVVNQIVEIDPVYPNGMFAIDGSYSNFLSKKEEFLKGQIQQERSLASKARKESEWLRASPKARTTKSKSRVEDAHELLQELSDVKGRNVQKKSRIDFTATERETRKLITVKNLQKSVGSKNLFNHLNFVLSPGTRMGLMGPNGSGKTTLLRILAGELTPDQGTLKVAEGLKIVYFDQHRTKLDETLTLKEALSPNGDFVNFRGQSIHVNGWCKRFLFTPDILGMPLAKLSGGERARISIAHLMLQPADVLLLDEPTNDLDIATLETLEENLLDFPGAIVLITHDRCMLDRICNVVLSLENPDSSILYADYSQWENAQKPAASAAQGKESKKEKSSPKSKLSFSEKKEYNEIEGKIQALEGKIQTLNHSLEDTAVTENPSRLQEVCTTISLLETQIEQLFLRWDELDKKLKNAPD